jgi:hypothetical protein
VERKVPCPTEAVSVIFLNGMRKTINRAPFDYESKSITALPSRSLSRLLTCRQMGMPKLMAHFCNFITIAPKRKVASRERPEKSGCPLQYVDLRGGGGVGGGSTK